MDKTKANQKGNLHGKFNYKTFFFKAYISK